MVGSVVDRRFRRDVASNYSAYNYSNNSAYNHSAYNYSNSNSNTYNHSNNRTLISSANG